MAGGGNSLFGFTSTSDIYVGSACFVIIVGYLVLAEHILSSLETKFVSAGYREMIKSLYMELVIMGISSFVLSMILFSGNSNSEWILHLVRPMPIAINFCCACFIISLFLNSQEIAEITLFFATIYHVILSLGLMTHTDANMIKIQRGLSRATEPLLVSFFIYIVSSELRILCQLNHKCGNFLSERLQTQAHFHRVDPLETQEQHAWSRRAEGV
jgi:hypothetical protein